MPTEEVFTTPHKDRAEGYARSTKPTYPFDREVTGAFFRFEGGEVVEYRAETGMDVLAQFFEIAGTKRLGEVALVDVDSPVNQTGVLFREILFDENAVCHIAFGEAYPGGVEGGDAMSRDELDRYGVNVADDHLDVMIGTESMKLTATCADGSEVVIMRDGRFTEEALEEAAS
jgi:aminopeptidase